MSQKTGLYRRFAKAFAMKIARIIFLVAVFLIAAALLFGVMYVAVEIASLVLGVTPIEKTRPVHFGISLAVLVFGGGLLGLAHSAWQEAKADNA